MIRKVRFFYNFWFRYTLLPFSIAITSLGEERASLGAFRMFVRFALVWFCLFPLPLGVWEGLRFVIVAVTGLFSYPFFFSTYRSKAVVPVLVLLFVALFFVVVVVFFCCVFLFFFFFLRGDLFYVLPCVILFLCFSVLLALRLPRLWKRALILVIFVRLFDLRLFYFVCFLFLLVSGKGCGLWLLHSLEFSLTFFCYIIVKRKNIRKWNST